MELLFLCIFIFIARIMDVTLGTLRTIMTIRGKNKLATFLGFLEVTVWFLMAKNALNSDSNSIFIVLSYAGGYATGTYIGGYLSRFIKSKLCIQLVIEEDNVDLINELRDNGFAVTVMNVSGYRNDSNKYMLLLEIDSDKYKKVKKIINKHNKNVFMMLNETKYVRNGFFGGITK